jgi:hypothetical protein
VVLGRHIGRDVFVKNEGVRFLLLLLLLLLDEDEVELDDGCNIRC